jgi:RHS repeat-associated protein
MKLFCICFRYLASFLLVFGAVSVFAQDLPPPTLVWSDGRPAEINTNPATVAQADVRNLSGTVVKSSGSQTQSTGDTSDLPGNEFSEYGRSLKSRKTIATLGPDLFGDDVDLYSGGLSFSATDISLPGNSSLPVEIRRNFRVRDVKKINIDDFSMGEWELDIPNLNLIMRVQTDASGAPVNRFQWTAYPEQKNCTDTYWQAVVAPTITTFYKTYSGVDNIYLDVTQRTRPSHYWNGRHANMPYGGEIMWPNENHAKPNQGGPYLWATKEGAYFSCLSTLKNAAGEGYLAITPDGTKYWFDWAASSHESVLWPAPNYPMGRRKRSLYVSRVEDRFGNWVTYSYSNHFNSPVKLDSIQASDGRQLNITYAVSTYSNYSYVSSITDGMRIWKYEYVNFNTPFPSLKKVTLPDQTFWQYDFAVPYGLNSAQVNYFQYTDGRRASHTCVTAPIYNPFVYFVGTIKHPSGAMADFRVDPKKFGRTSVAYECALNTTFSQQPLMYNAQNYSENKNTVEWIQLALTHKRIYGPGIAERSWAFTYNSASGAGASCRSEACAGRSISLVAGNDGTYDQYTFGNTFEYDEGKLLQHDRGDATGSKELNKTVHQLDFTSVPYPTPVGLSPQRSIVSSYNSEVIIPAKTNELIRDGVSFKSTVEGFNEYALPISIRKSSSLIGAAPTTLFSKSEAIQYEHNYDKYVLNQVKKVTDTTNPAPVVVASTNFDAATALPTERYEFGLLKSRFAYNADGTTASISDANLNITRLSNYKRGLPQRVDYADNSFETAIVNDVGWIASTTDERTNTTAYEYDAMGRLNKLTPPIGDATVWNASTFSFSQLSVAAYGLPIGAWKHSFSKGNMRTETYLDALWRPVVTREYDNTNVVATQRFSRVAYDSEGRPVFKSYPGKGDVITQGIRTQYDILGRVTSTKQDSEIGELVTTFEYLPGFKTRTTNPRGKSTTVTYQVFDEPEASAPILIQSPEFQKTTISRDVFGKPTEILKESTETVDCLGGGSCPQPKALYSRKYYVYDEYQRVCKRVEPETNATIFDYDAVGNLLWSAQGSLLTDRNSCDRANVVATDKIVRSYDSMNRQRMVDVPNSASDLSYNYLPGGLLSSVSNGGVMWSYSYNKINLPTTEVLSLDNRTKTISHRYDANGTEDLLTLPSGLAIPYSPNALGQVAQAGTFATNATYRSNGTMSGFSYGNAVVHSQLPNLRGLPAKRTDSLGSNLLQDERLAFDANGNVRCIRDNTPGNGGHRDMYYDGMDRLSDTMAPNQWWISAFYQYDALDNLTFQRLGNRHYTYIYDAQQRLEKVNQPVNITPVEAGVLNACTENALSADIGTLSQDTGGGTTPPGGGGSPGGGGNPPGGGGQQGAAATNTSATRTTAASSLMVTSNTSVTTAASTAAAEPFTTLYQFGYDANGNIISGRQDIVYDALNRVTQVTGKESYVYDGHGRRVKTTRLSDNKINYSVYGLNGQLITEDDARDNKKTDYVYLNGRLVAQRSAALAGTASQTSTYVNAYLHTDSLGSPVAQTSQTGVVTKIERYTPYGEPSDNSYNQGPGFTGHVTDALTGLTYAQQRYYDPMLGRFLSPDPVETNPNSGASFNRYNYANNNPYRYTDPDGRAPNDGERGDFIGRGIAAANSEHRARTSTNPNVRYISAQSAANYYREIGLPEKARQITDQEISSRPRTARDPKSIRNLQDDIRPVFTDQRSIHGMINDLKSGKLKPEDITPIRVFVDTNGNLTTLDHRRLYAHLQAGVPIQTVDANQTEINIDVPKKRSTRNNGESVTVRTGKRKR